MKPEFIDDAVASDGKLKPLDVECSCSAEVLWYRVPGTEWTDAEARKQRDDAVAFFRKYCIQLTFREFTLDGAKDSELQKSLDRWVKRYGEKVKNIPRGKAAPESSLNEIQELVERIYKVIADKENARRKEAEKKDKKANKDLPTQLLTVLFLDEWYINSSESDGGLRPVRVTATHQDYWLIGLLRYDRDSQNELTHELTHALRRDSSLAGRNKKCEEKFVAKNGVTKGTQDRSWGDHYPAGAPGSDKAMTRPSRRNPFLRENKFTADQALSVKEYMMLLEAGYLKCKDGCTEADLADGTGTGTGTQPKDPPPSQETPKDRKLRFGGVELPRGILLGWGGTPPSPGTAGYVLYRMDLAPDGVAPVALHDGLLPIDGTFLDESAVPALVAFDDPFAALLEELGEPSAGSSNSIQDWVDFLQSGDGSPLRPWVCDGPILVDPSQYLLVDFDAAGERQGEHEPQVPACTEEEKARAKREVEKALQKIRERGLIDKIDPNPGHIDYDKLVANIVKWFYECDLPAEGRTWPDGIAEDGTNKRKSEIHFNVSIVNLLDDETLLALVFHELAHAFQNLSGLPAKVFGPDIADVAIAMVAREIFAFNAVWDRLAALDIHLPKGGRCREMATAVREILDKFKALAERIATGDKPLTDDQKQSIREMRAAGKALLNKYKSFLEAFPAGTDGCTFVDDAGQTRPMIEILDKLLLSTFQ